MSDENVNDVIGGSNSRFIGRRDNAPIDERPMIDFDKPMWSWVAYSKSTGYAMVGFAVNGDTEELALQAGTDEFERQKFSTDLLGQITVERLYAPGRENGSSIES